MKKRFNIIALALMGLVISTASASARMLIVGHEAFTYLQKYGVVIEEVYSATCNIDIPDVVSRHGLCIVVNDKIAVGIDLLAKGGRVVVFDSVVPVEYMSAVIKETKSKKDVAQVSHYNLRLDKISGEGPPVIYGHYFSATLKQYTESGVWTVVTVATHYVAKEDSDYAASEAEAVLDSILREYKKIHEGVRASSLQNKRHTTALWIEQTTR